jgi:hypothetical protein
MLLFYRKLSFLIAVLICTPVAAFADRYDSLASPFAWSVLIQDSRDRKDGTSTSTSYKDESINTLIATGVRNNALDTSCNFEFQKAVNALGDGSARHYSESFRIHCQVGKVNVEIGVISCSQAFGDPSPRMSLGAGGPSFEQWPAKLSILVLCGSKPVKSAQ